MNILNHIAESNVEIAPVGEGFSDLGGGISISTLLSGLITLILIIAAVVFFFMLIMGGLRWILSGGDKASTEGARNQITAALIGLIVVFGAFAAVTIVDALFGVNIFSFELPSLVDGAGT